MKLRLKIYVFADDTLGDETVVAEIVKDINDAQTVIDILDVIDSGEHYSNINGTCSFRFWLSEADTWTLYIRYRQDSTSNNIAIQDIYGFGFGDADRRAFTRDRDSIRYSILNGKFFGPWIYPGQWVSKNPIR